MSKQKSVMAADAPDPMPTVGAHTHERSIEVQEPPAESDGTHTHDIPMAEISVVDLEQLRAENASFKGKLADLQAAYDSLVAERDTLATQVAQLDARLNPPPEIARPRSCINCGQRAVPIGWDGEVFSCPVCKHAWPPADEMAPFRQGR